METKTLLLSDCQIKMEGDTGSFRGYASVFNGLDSYGDTILPGAFKGSLKAHGMPKMFLMHESWNLPVGRYTKAVEDKTGLLMEGEFTPGMVRAQDARAAMKHETLDGLSIGFRMQKGDWDENPDTDIEDGRIIKNISHLVEVSPVVFPADDSARITGVKTEKTAELEGEINALQTVREFELFLRDVGGLSKGLAVLLTSRAKVVFEGRDASADKIKVRFDNAITSILNNPLLKGSK